MTETDTPNVLFIAIDDLRPELGCYGAEHIRSPNIDSLASRGVLFKRAYCQAPHCGPSRSSLLTGIRARNDALHMNVGQLSPGALTLPGAFRRAGYYTLSNGKIFHELNDMATESWSEPPFWLVGGDDNNNHLTFHDRESANFILAKNGRGPFFEAPGVPDNTYIDGQTCDKTIGDLRRLAAMDKPFFLACGFVRPHLPFYAPKKYWDLYDRQKIAIADNRFRPEDAPDALQGSREMHSYHDRDIEYNSPEFHKIARHGYYACVSYADALVGKLLATLDELGLRDNTIVVLWGDHGWNLGEHNFWGKHNLLHTSVHAPLIISAPGYERNVKTEGIVELIDIYPTLCELAGIDLPQQLEGASLVPLMQDPERTGKKAAYARWRNGAGVTTRDFTYTEWDNDQFMLFDHRNDPDENRNVAGKPEYRGTVEELRKLLSEGWKDAEAGP
jgi:arylsulfatase A-like enzyme